MLTAKQAFEITKGVNNNNAFLKSSHIDSDLFRIISQASVEGKYDTRDSIIKLNAHQYFNLINLGFSIDCFYIESPMGLCKKTLVKHIISWEKL